MDYSKYTTTQLTAVANMLVQFDSVMMDDLPEDFVDILAEYVEMDEAERAEMQKKILVKANFLAYAELLNDDGDFEKSAEIAKAIEKVAEDISKLDSSDLKTIAAGGVDQMTKVTKEAVKE